MLQNISANGLRSPNFHLLNRRERAVILSQALASLSGDYREVPFLHRPEGLKMAEVAVRMGRSVDSVQKPFARGLVEMRRLLEDLL